MASLADIEGIVPAYAEKLKNQGLRTTEDLLKAGATPQGREGPAAATGISSKLILHWVNVADLFHLKGVGEEYSDLLEAAGIGTLIIALAVLFLGGNPGTVLNQNQDSGFAMPPTVSTLSPWEERLKEFASVVLADTEDVWTAQFQQMGETYQKPFLMLYSGTVDTPSGYAGAASGPRVISPKPTRSLMRSGIMCRSFSASWTR